MIDIKSVDPLALPCLSLDDRKALPSIPAVYFAIDKTNVIQYIGKAIDLKQRWAGHHRFDQLSEMDGIRIAYLQSEQAYLETIEFVSINHFSPLLNGNRICVNRSTCHSDRCGRLEVKVFDVRQKADKSACGRRVESFDWEQAALENNFAVATARRNAAN